MKFFYDNIPAFLVRTPMVIIIYARSAIATQIAYLGSTEQFIDSGKGADGIIEKLHFPGSYTSIKCSNGRAKNELQSRLHIHVFVTSNIRRTFDPISRRI